MKAYFTFLLTVSLLNVWSQQNSDIQIQFNPTFKSKQLVLNQYFELNSKDSIQFSSFKFYLSNLKLLKDNETVHNVESGNFLIDLEAENSQKINLSIPEKVEFNQLSFDLGIDSTTNVSGALGGALDPTSGMYWTWQSGYINLKLEGNLKNDGHEEIAFVFHLGGYQYPFNSLQKVTIPTIQKNKILVTLALENWVSEIDFGQIQKIMSPRKEAVEMSQKVTKIFTIQ